MRQGEKGERSLKEMMLGCSLLKQGAFDRGWTHYEARHVLQNTCAGLPHPVWRGEPLEGRTVLVLREQGVGDEVWFASCLRDLLATGCRVTVNCDERLGPLFRRSFPGIGVLTSPRASNHAHRWRFMEVDYVIPFGNLFSRFRTSLADFPGSNVFLRPDHARVRYWSERLASIDDRPKVGLSWQGGPKPPDLRRAPDSFWKAALPEGVTFVNVQHRASSDLDPPLIGEGRRFVELHGIDLTRDLDDLAALLGALDAVVSVPNTTVHLAAGIGARVLMPFDAAWQCFWVLGDGSVPYYPTVETYVARGGDWEPAASALRRHLETIRQ